MEKHKFKQYIFALSTLSMLNSGCSLGPNLLGVNTSDNFIVSDRTIFSQNTSGIKQRFSRQQRFTKQERSKEDRLAEQQRLAEQEKLKQDKILVLFYLNEPSKDPVYYRHVAQQLSSRFERKIISIKGRLFNVFEPKKILEEYVSRLKKHLYDNLRWSQEKIDKEWNKLDLMIVTQSEKDKEVASKFYQKFKDILNVNLLSANVKKLETRKAKLE